MGNFNKMKSFCQSYGQTAVLHNYTRNGTNLRVSDLRFVTGYSKTCLICFKNFIVYIYISSHMSIFYVQTKTYNIIKGGYFICLFFSVFEKVMPEQTNQAHHRT